MNKNKEPKILFLDLEIMANLAWVWQKYETNVIEFEKEWYLLSAAYKWLGENKTHVVTLRDFKGYKPGTDNDKGLIKKIWEVMNEADIIVGHNSVQFDIRKINSRFIFHGLTPPSPSKNIDTLKICRKKFGFTSNKLDDVVKLLGLGEKEQTGGWKLWKGCYLDDDKSWNTMKRYNKQDVIILEKLYIKLLPWIDNHPGVSDGCNNCGAHNLVKSKLRMTRTGLKQQWQCKDCGAYKTTKCTLK